MPSIKYYKMFLIPKTRPENEISILLFIIDKTEKYGEINNFNINI